METVHATDDLVVEPHPDDDGFYGKPYVWIRRLDDQTDGVVYLDEVRALLDALATVAAETAEMVVRSEGR